MAVTPGVGSIWLYSIRMTRSSQRMQMSTLLSPPSSLVPADYLTFCANFLANQRTAGSPLDRLQSACCVGTNFDSHDIQAIYPTRLVNFTELLASPWNGGTLAGDPPPPNSAGTFERYTENGTRAGRGNMHPPVGIRTDINANGTWASTTLTPLSNVALRWIQPFSSTGSVGDMLPVLWNRSAPGVINRMLGFKVNNYIRTMRRRTVGLGI